MDGITAREIAERLGISYHAAIVRIKTANIEPKYKAGSTFLFDESVVEQIREVSKGGRPRKDKPNT
jgi:transposase